MINLSGKKAVVAGSEGLIGKRISDLLQTLGADLLGMDFKSSDSLWCDITTPYAWEKIDDYASDIFVNASYPSSFTDHYRAFIDSTAYIAAGMAKRKGGVIVNLASIYALVGPCDSMYEDTDMTMPDQYAAVKGAIVAHSRCLAVRYAPKVRINAVAAGGVQDKQSKSFIQRYCERTPMKRMATPEDIAKVVVFLVSDWASYITGQCITVDGGYTAQ